MNPTKQPIILPSRRNFLAGGAAALGAGAMASTGLASSLFVQGKDEMKVALVGCGGRGRGAVNDAMKAGEASGHSIKVVACADWFADRAKKAGEDYGIDPEQCFGGGDAYKKACASDADYVILATPPIFRPVHFREAVKNNKHVFMEKPVSVDPAGCRHVIETGEMATNAKLNVVAGTQRRHEASYQSQKEFLDTGEIGEIRGGTVSWCQNALWYKTRNSGDSNADYLVRNWVSFLEMSGDHIVEQHVHNIDVAIWFIGRAPRSAVGFGGRARRETGNQYDFFSTDFDFGEGVHIQSMCRQINETAGNVGEHFATESGQVWGGRRIAREGGSPINAPRDESTPSPYVQEHIDLQNSIAGARDYANEAEQVTMSCAAAIMGRIAAYTGGRVQMDELLSDSSSPYYNRALAFGPDAFEQGSEVPMPEEGVAPVPGAPAGGPAS